MRTTIRLDDHLLREAKARAAVTGQSLNDFIGDAVRAAIIRRPVAAVPQIPTFRGNGLQPGVDLDDAASLLELMETEDHPYAFAPAPRRKVAEPAD